MSETNNELNSDFGSQINDIITSPIITTLLAIVIIAYIIINVFLGGSSTLDTNGNTSGSNSALNIIMSFIFIIFVILLVLNALYYLFRVDIFKTLRNFINGIFQLEIISDIKDINLLVNNRPIEENSQSRVAAIQAPVPAILLTKQVFNVPENTFVYDDAKALCSAYGSRLATYQEVESAYNDGAEWCNYGWSEKQMALFPTQQKTYNNLQKIKGHENDCGRPGVNGGFIADPNSKFGVNCYGYKPRMTPEEEEIMATRPIYPKTKKDIELEERVNYWKDKLSSILVSPFNHTTWSRL
jgi:hypothetical protein